MKTTIYYSKTNSNFLLKINKQCMCVSKIGSNLLEYLVYKNKKKVESGNLYKKMKDWIKNVDFAYSKKKK